MKVLRIVLLVAVAAGTIALIWQGRTIHELRTELAGLQKDLNTALANGLDDHSLTNSRPGLARAERMELIALRHQVRELNDSLLASHARERNASLRSLVEPLLPKGNSGGTWNFRSEWHGMENLATNQYVQAMKSLDGATNDLQRYLTLDRAAKMSLAVGRTKDARQFATDLLVLDKKFRDEKPMWVGGDATHDGNLVLGVLALDDGKTEDAKRYLLAAGQSTGSPVLGSFGPNMMLAKELLENHEQEAVLQYLELCRKFWGSGSDKLDEWTKAIEAGQMPQFGANLIY